MLQNLLYLLFLAQALLPWVTGSFSEEEKEAMMGSLREATKNTMFDQWLGAVQQSGAAAAAAASAGTAIEDQQGSAPAAAAGAGAVAAPEQQQQQQMPMSDLAEIAEYLAGSGSLPQVLQQQQLPLGSVPPALHQQQCLTEVSGTVAESTNYVPGWEDIFNINQKQLEAAIRRVSNDPNLEPQRKAYLIQNIMVSRYIVAQQRRMQTGGGSAGAAAAAATAGAAAAGQMLPPAVQHQHVQHQHAPAHGNMAGGCCHHDAHADRQQQQQHHVQVQPSSSSAVTAPQQQQQQPVRTYADAAAGVLGCKHYRRSAQLVAPCCGKVFTCRCVESFGFHALIMMSKTGLCMHLFRSSVCMCVARSCKGHLYVRLLVFRAASVAAAMCPMCSIMPSMERCCITACLAAAHIIPL
jgi:zinc finger-like protein